MSLEFPALQYIYKDPNKRFTVIHVYKQEYQITGLGPMAYSRATYLVCMGIPFVSCSTACFSCYLNKNQPRKSQPGSLSSGWLRG